jgi:hypothetical protein
VIEDAGNGWENAGEGEGDSGGARDAGAATDGADGAQDAQKQQRKVPPLGGRNRARPR